MAGTGAVADHEADEQADRGRPCQAGSAALHPATKPPGFGHATLAMQGGPLAGTLRELTQPPHEPEPPFWTASGLRCLAVVAAHNAMFWRLFDSL
jgi:hypothetical protein